MIDLSNEFQKFYRTCVVLPEKEQAKLRDKEKKNIKRLKSGLTAYNTEFGTEYKIRKTVRQGSMAMHTTVQNDQRDYDIDVAVVFDRDNLDDLGPLQARRMLADAIRLKSGKFLHPPECKTGCVRVYYEEGYHLDLPVFRQSDRGSSCDILYEYARLDWSERNVYGVNEWFRDRISARGDILRKIIRLSKMFCKSRENWNMPSGLIQTVLCDECLQVCEGLDESFLCTMKRIVDAMTDRDSIILPLDGGRELLERELDRQRVKNWRTRLKENLMKVEADVSKPYSTHEEGMWAWYDFFQHPFWASTKNEALLERYGAWHEDRGSREEFIEDQFDVMDVYDLEIHGTMIKRGYRKWNIWDWILRCGDIAIGFHLRFWVDEPWIRPEDEIYWKVRNVGEYARRNHCERGEIQRRGKVIEEHSDFSGEHYVECYVVRNGVCIAIGHLNVPIG